MTITAISRWTQEGVQACSQGKYSYGIPVLGRKVKTLALTAFALFSLANVPVASAGPVAYAICVADCLALTLGGFVPFCLATCAPCLAAPTP